MSGSIQSLEEGRDNGPRTLCGRGAPSLAAFVRSVPRLFVLTGAGCSTGAGIPDYRDEEGAWKHRPPVQFQDFITSPSTRRRYWARSLVGWARVSAARPTAAHAALSSCRRDQAQGHVLAEAVGNGERAAGMKNRRSS